EGRGLQGPEIPEVPTSTRLPRGFLAWFSHVWPHSGYYCLVLLSSLNVSTPQGSSPIPSCGACPAPGVPRCAALAFLPVRVGEGYHPGRVSGAGLRQCSWWQTPWDADAQRLFFLSTSCQREVFFLAASFRVPLRGVTPGASHSSPIWSTMLWMY